MCVVSCGFPEPLDRTVEAILHADKLKFIWTHLTACARSREIAQAFAA
jgi:hypothetical protein